MYKFRAPSRSPTLGEWLDRWLAEVAIARPRTVDVYRGWCKHLRGSLGDVPLRHLTPDQIRGMLAAKLAEGLSGTSVLHLWRVLGTALRAAVDEELIDVSPRDRVRRPEAAVYEALTLTTTEATRLLATCRWDRLGALVWLAVHTGAREGELFALTWRDVDLDVGAVSITKSVRWRSGIGPVVGPTKTRSGRRTLSIPPEVVRVVEAHRRAQRTEQLAIGAAWGHPELVFSTNRGGYLNPSGFLARYWYPLLIRAQCPRIRFHDLRHTAGLFYTRAGGIVVASRQLGHATPAITARFYGHAQTEDMLLASQRVGAMLAG